MSSIVILVYYNGRMYHNGDDGVIFEGSRKAIQIRYGITFDGLKIKIRKKLNLEANEVISSITSRFLVSNKYIALQLCDDKDVEILIGTYEQQERMSVIELYIEVDVLCCPVVIHLKMYQNL